jgi:nucleoporin NUP1
MEGPKGGIPNFFARSAAFNKPLEIKTPPLTFSPHPTELPEVEATPPALMPVPLPVFSLSTPSGNGTPSVSSGATSLFGSPAPSAPMKDAGNPFWDGEKKMETLKKDEPQAAPVSVFGAAAQENPAKEAKASGPASSLFGDANKTTTAPAPFSAQAVKPVETADTAKPPIFTFGAPASTTSLFGVKPNEGVPTSNEFPPSFFGTQKASGTTSTAFTPAGGSSITDSNKQPTSLFGATPKPKAEVGKPASATAPSTHATATTPFSYGQPAAPPNVEAPKPVVSNGSSLHFGNALPTETKIPSPIPFIFSSSSEKDATKPATPPALFPFGAPEKETKPTSPAPFSFTGPEETKATSPAPFTFVAPSTPVAAEKTAPFTYGTPSASPVPPSVFSFSAGGSTTGDVSKPLQLDRPVTPPKNGDQEFKMEESPTREVQQTNANSKPDFTGFNFGNPPSSGSVLFGGPTSAPPTTTPFPFSSNSPSNLFAAPPMKESKSEGPKPFTFGQSIAPTSATSTGFSFSQTTQNPESPRPSTGGSFGFGGGPSTPTTTASGFNFGATPASNPFGQQQSGGSAPSSPSTFQAGTFNFSSASSGTGFGFGSQPASPATGSTNLPPATTPFGGGNTGFNSSAPSSPFNAPGQIAPSTSSGGTLFTIGAAPPLQTGTQGRAIKKLPNRNRAKR